MISLVKQHDFFKPKPEPMVRDYEHQLLIFKRGEYLFVFNLSPTNSYENYLFEAAPGKYQLVLDTDEKRFDGFQRLMAEQEYFTIFSEGRNELSLYIPARTALLLERC